MAQKKKRPEALTLKVSLGKKFDGDIVAHVFDRHGTHLSTEPVRNDQLRLKLSEDEARKSRVFLAPAVEGQEKVTLQAMERLSGYEVVMAAGHGAPIRERIEVPELVVDYWFYCACLVRGRVVRPVGTQSSTQDLPVCGARVHICEVDHWPLIIAKLPDLEILKLRDDLIEIIERPPRPRPPFPDPPIDPPLPDPPGPRPDPSPFLPRSPLRLDDPASIVGFNPQPDPPGTRFRDPASIRGFNPQPEPPGSRVGFNPQPEPPRPLELQSTELLGLRAASVNEIRSALIANIDLLQLYICYWPWWWARFRCDEVAVIETDAFGRFETTIYYPCPGDHPDLYFWVEYPVGGVWQTVWRPPIPCWTHWNYACGTEVTIRVTDPRVPACGHDPDLPGLVVSVMSIGRTVSLQEIQGAGAGTNEGLTTGGAPFGGKLEPRVWFSRANLIAAGVTHYRWSYRRLTEPDGVTPDVGPWTIMTRVVGRHYAVLGPGNTLAFPFDVLGPDGDNKFRIQPPDPTDPAAIDWHVLDEREDVATAHFETTLLPHGLSGSPSECQKAEQTAGRYELKLELLRGDNSIVDWTTEGIDLKIADDPAPFGTGVVDTINAPAYNRILDASGHLVGFRMVVRVDNNCCRAQIHPVSGAGLTVDADCGFIEYAPGAQANISLDAEHPWGFATFSMGVTRGTGTPVPQASASGVAGAPTAASTGGNFAEGPPFRYTKTVPVSTLLSVNTPPGNTPCENAAFAEVLHVYARATDGYGTLTHLNRGDAAAFALATPCECD